MRTCHVTGSTEFLDSHPCAQLPRKSGRIICRVVNSYAGRIERVVESQGDAMFLSVLHGACDTFDPGEQIYSLVGTFSPLSYQGWHSFDTARTCVAVTLYVPESTAVYSAHILQVCTVNHIDMCACYYKRRRCTEGLGSDYHKYEGVSIRVVRFSDAYVPGVPPIRSLVLRDGSMDSGQGW